MSRSANIVTRVDPEVKKQAEDILNKLGLSMSSAMDIFLRQIIIRNGLPFEVTLSNSKPLMMANMNKQEFDKALEEGVKDVKEGKTISVDELLSKLQKERGL